MPLIILVVIIIAVALVFDFLNGFHDAANSVATIVATRVLTPFQAVLWAAFFNFVSAFGFGTEVAKTVGRGFVDISKVTPEVILAGLLGAIAWDLITWWFGLPTSSSHALIGGYAGAAVAHAGLHGLIRGQWPNTVLMMVAAPLIGLVLAYGLMIAVYWLFRHSTPSKMDFYFRKLQLLSAAGVSLAHGTNDAQKTMGIITSVLVTSRYLDKFVVPTWVIFAACAAIALGTMSGGWRIVHTMGGRLTRLKPRSGFCAESAAAFSILFSSAIGQPVSTTHVIAGSIAGVGSIHRFKAVRWGIATNIMWAWLLTIPAAGIIAWLSFHVLTLLFPHGMLKL